MKFPRRVLALLSILSFTFSVQAQEDADYRMEIGGALGTCFYLGDLNNTFYKDTGAAVGAVWRYLFNPRSAMKASLMYGGVKGTADVSLDYLPQHPDIPAVSTPLSYSFSSHVVDLSFIYELNFWPYGYYQGYKGYKRLTPFMQLGLGMTYMGEGKSATANIPIGLGLKYRLSKRWNLALDWAIHFSMSDKIDGLIDPIGISSEGLKNKDSYQVTVFTLTYNFSPICPACNKD
ncbi:MAG: outer membrane beta-barrel protein [Bacteroidaceae bacterium]|nr:outer membrane beta-barrel protein [Bacteroidaceae bacterium]